MNNQKQINQRSILMRSSMINTIIMVVGVLIVATVLFSLQKQNAIQQTQNTLSRSLDSVMDILDTNTVESDLLIGRAHRDNQAITNDLAELIFHSNNTNLQRIEQTDAASYLSALSEVVGDHNELFVAGKDGTIICSTNPERAGLHLVQDGIFTEEQREQLQRSKTIDNHRYNGTYVETLVDDTVVLMDSEPVRGHFGAEGKEAYFYSIVQDNGDTLIYETYTSTLNTLLNNIGDITTVFSNAVMEHNGFLLAVDQEGEFAYFDDGKEVLTGRNYSESGLTEDALKEKYSGIQQINGIKYQCQSRVYSSSLYGDGIVITAALPDNFVSKNHFIASVFTIILFAGIAVIIMIYTRYLKADPGQIVGYDKKVLKEKGRNRRHAIRKDMSIRNAEAFRAFGRQYYYKVGVAKRIAPVIVLGLTMILLVSWNSQRLTKLTQNMVSADSSMEQLESLFENSNSNTELLTSTYERHYLSKIKLISDLVELDPSALNEKEGVYTYLDDRFNQVLDADGNPITSVSNSSVLKQYAKQNGIDEIYIFDDHGHVISSSNDTWKFTLSTDSDDQSYEFRKILTGESAELIQKPMINDLGNARQYMAAPLYYYTLQGKGSLAGQYVSKETYENYVRNGSCQIEDASYEIIPHRGMIQAGISDTRIDKILESTSPSYLIQQFKVGDDGYAMILENSDEHVCLWSPVESDIGKTAEALGISENGFSGYYKGFTKIAGTKYLQHIKFDNNYWVVLNMTQSAVFAGDLEAALISTVISAVFYMIMFFFCTFSSEEEEKALEDLLKEKSKKEEKSNMTANQKMSGLISLIATLLGCAVVAVTAFEQKIFQSSSSLHYILNGNWDKGLNYFAGFYCVIVLIYIAVAASAISVFVSFIIRNMGSRVETVGKLILSVIKYGSVLFGVFYSMTILGISTSGVITSAGIFSVVVGLGAQSLISDILSGIFIIFEGAFKVGDIVEINGFCGYVREIGIRTTMVEDYLGDIKIFNNSQISGILNHTKKDSYVMCKVGISYGEDIERVEKVILTHLPKIKHKIPGLVGELHYSGVLKLDDSAVIIGIGGRCHEGGKRFFTRKLLREILILFRDNNINIPFPQLTISYENESAQENGEKTL